ncbi:unnamed protein product [Linum trigynum]|uniref:Uncharacterized protein n=1 Tax=Linum trigynum TaxID=586398 RepID=A0AAV2CRM4_9ROSI
MPAPARPSFRDDERIVPPQEPPRRSRRRVRANIEELHPTQQTQLPEKWPHCEWATSTEGTRGSSSYIPTQEHDMFYHQQQTPMNYQTPQQQHTTSTFYHASGSSQQIPPPPPPVYTLVGVGLRGIREQLSSGLAKKEEVWKAAEERVEDVVEEEVEKGKWKEMKTTSEMSMFSYVLCCFS